ncbi:MAG: hypothetical protein ACYS0K_21900 [Planctomycetota bacterium]|jgi:hypothetical protein
MMLRTSFLLLGVAFAVGLAGETDVSFEEEPNDAIPQVLDMGPGAQPGDPVSFRIKGWIGSTGDVDGFALELNTGDVVGAVATDTSTLHPRLCLEDAAGDLVIGNDDKFAGAKTLYFPRSPLPVPDEGADGDAFLATVIPVAGEYVLEVAGEDGTTGRYRLDIAVARPGLEAHAVGTRQIIFVDFDGAKINMGAFSNEGGAGTKTLSPMADFLGAWGLTAADEDEVIDTVLETLVEKLSTDIRDRGLNGDYASSSIPGEFDVEIRNSRDHADTYGLDPLVTRLVIGGTQAEAGISVFGVASALDPGNFSTDDEALLLLDQLAGLTPGNINRDLNQFSVAAGRTKAELVGRALARIGMHELAHVFGCRHTDSTNTVFDILDRGTPHGFDPVGAGPDKILGTADDVDWEFGVDAYDSREELRGVHDTLNTIAFGLATGRK